LFAKNLEYLFAEFCQRSDLSADSRSEFSDRFEALRGFGKLPRGRNNRDRRLSTTQIAAAVFGLVPTNPRWAGHAAVLLADLRPIGGIAATFRGSATLTQAVECL
jgi:hypothetical protein